MPQSLSVAGIYLVQTLFGLYLLAEKGLASWFDQESDLDAVVAISGSGPAYFFMMMEAMEEAGTKLGLSTESARELTLQTALGAAKLAQASDVPPAELRRRVTSPGGVARPISL